MATLKIPKLYGYYTANQTEISLVGDTVADVLNCLYATHPAIQKQLVDAKGDLRRHINVFVNKVNISSKQGLQTPVTTDDTIMILPNISGG